MGYLYRFCELCGILVDLRSGLIVEILEPVLDELFFAGFIILMGASSGDIYRN